MATIRKRKNRDATIGYQAQVRLKGYPAQSATFSRRSDAKRSAQKTEAAIREGRHFPAAELRKHTLSEAINRYLHEVMPRKKESTRHPQSLQLGVNGDSNRFFDM